MPALHMIANQVHEKKGFRCIIAGSYEHLVLVLEKIRPLMILVILMTKRQKPQKSGKLLCCNSQLKEKFKNLYKTKQNKSNWIDERFRVSQLSFSRQQQCLAPNLLPHHDPAFSPSPIKSSASPQSRSYIQQHLHSSKFHLDTASSLKTLFHKSTVFTSPLDRSF